MQTHKLKIEEDSASNTVPRRSRLAQNGNLSQTMSDTIRHHTGRTLEDVASVTNSQSEYAMGISVGYKSYDQRGQ